MSRFRMALAGLTAAAGLLIPAGVAHAAVAPSSATAHRAGPQVAVFAPLCEKDSPFLCWRDLSDGGPGTKVVNSGFGTDQAREWSAQQDTSRCGGFVSNSLACPFTPGSGLNSEFNGREIVFVKNQGSGYCAGSSNAQGGLVFMHTCDSNSVAELATVFVVEQFSGHFRLVSVLQSDLCSCNPLYITGDNANDDQLLITQAGTYSRWTGGGL